MDSIQLEIETPDPDEFDAQILAIISEAIAPDPTPAKDAALAIDTAYKTSLAQNPNRTPGGSLLCFWDVIHSFAMQIPHEHPAQEKLVAVLKELNDVTSTQIVLDKPLWNGLPYFSAEVPQSWQHLSPEAGDDVKKQRFVNLQAYLARVFGLGLESLEMYALWSLSDAVEGAIVPVRGSPDLVSAEPGDIVDLPFKTAAAAVWIIHAGAALHGRDEEISGTDAGPLWKLSKKEAKQARRKYKGTKGLCAERWDLWKTQFAAIRDYEGADEETRTIAGRAVERMDKLN
ncbi:hypothetical protein BDV25DRAFT_135253 [Aspergillus avenaceus]|uniref:Uncharacterized protein n=1 Tax=Aspergillus avenaceus TaxID=36643 RepID=A0A5N6U9A8_ASPAV|nr:hypothetical protein BDV25DRAFT_135253 [Aspergillus avenaceus]